MHLLKLQDSSNFQNGNFGATPCNSQGEIIIAKHRNGSLKDVRLKFTGKYAKFSNLDGLSQQDYMYNAGIKPNNDFGDDISSFTMPSKMNDDSSDPF